MAGNGPGYKMQPEHHVNLEHDNARVRVRFAGETIAESEGVITVRETGREPVFYFPRADVKMERLQRTDRRSHCPFKGQASYFTITGPQTVSNAVWSYEDPYVEVADLKERVAFYPEKVEITVL